MTADIDKFIRMARHRIRHMSNVEVINDLIDKGATPSIAFFATTAARILMQEPKNTQPCMHNRKESIERCKSCGQIIPAQDITAYAEEVGDPNAIPAWCEDCAELE